jgi:hypothetical protein
MSMILTKATGSARKKAASSEEQLTTAQLT